MFSRRSDAGGTSTTNKAQALVRPVLVSVAYLVLFSLLDKSAHALEEYQGVVAWYPPDGLSFALLLAFGAPFLPVVAIASLISSLFIFQLLQPAPTLLVWSIILVSVFGLATWFLRRGVRIDSQLRSPRDLFWMVTTAMAASTILAVISVSSSVADGLIPAADGPWAAYQWWIGEMIGILVVSPAVLIFVIPLLKRYGAAVDDHKKLSIPLGRTSLLVAAQSAAIVAAILLAVDVRWPNDYHPVFLIAIPVIWIALRHGLRGASLGNLLTNFGITLGVAWHRVGLAQLGEVQLAMLVTCVASLVTGLLVSERGETFRLHKTPIELQRGKVLNELIIVSLLGPAAWVMEYSFHFLEAVLNWETRNHIEGVHEALASLLVLAPAAAVFSYRRWKEGQKEIQKREQAQSELRTLLSELETRVQQRTADLSEANSRLQEEISEREQAENTLRASEDRYRDLVNNSRDLICTHDLEGQILSVNPYAEQSLGYEPGSLQDRNLRDLLAPGSRRQFGRYLSNLKKDGAADGILVILTANGEKRFWEYRNTLRTEGVSAPIVRSMARDVTEKREAERILRESEGRFRSLVENSADAITLLDASATVVYDSPAAPGLLGYSPDEWVGQNIIELLHPEDVAATLGLFQELAGIPGAQRQAGFRVRHKDGSWIWIEAGITNLLHNSSVRAIVANYRDVTNRKVAEQEIRSRSAELSTLFELSRSLLETNDVDKVLDLVTCRLVERVRATFARIILLEGGDLVARSGYPMRILEHDLLIGDRHPIASMPFCQQMLESEQPVLLRTGDPRLSPEERAALLLDFAKTVCIVPLQTHDEAEESQRILGLLAIGEARDEAREPFTPEKLRLARSIGDQAAVAIAKSRLFDNLQQSNMDLNQAYDATIAGWSAALDLRDRETEGHTQRVTEMTLRLARHMGFGEQELLTVKRGALLHDIGKMGIPDRILLKPDKLTAEEWEIMRMHPTYAYQMLEPITYLGSALDIPYCHHEKWDGTGYPRGLKGEEIPLAARIFAIVDVYDALTSDRPYRAAWPSEKTLDYIQELSGQQFDANVVDAFSKILEP